MTSIYRLLPVGAAAPAEAARAADPAVMAADQAAADPAADLPLADPAEINGLPRLTAKKTLNPNSQNTPIPRAAVIAFDCDIVQDDFAGREA